MKIVAEVACNHMGRVDLAYQMIDQLVGVVDYVKFQKRNSKLLLDELSYMAPHPHAENSFGANYGEHRDFLEFNLSTHRDLNKYCEARGIGYSCSVWDSSSAREIISLEPSYIKVPSACNLDFELIDILAREYTGEIHISLGMLSHFEIDFIFKFLKNRGVQKRAVFYSCTTGYPVAIKDLSLQEIVYLQATYGNDINAIGFSGHHQELYPDVAATAMGATWVERHFTLDKSLKGTDHRCSLVLPEMIILNEQLRQIEKSIHLKSDTEIELEKLQRKKLAPKLPLRLNKNDMGSEISDQKR